MPRREDARIEGQERERREVAPPAAEPVGAEEAGVREGPERSSVVKLALLASLVALGLAYTLIALGLPQGSLQRPEYGLFPLLVGLLLIPSAAIALLESFMRGETSDDSGDQPEDDEADPEEPSRPLPGPRVRLFSVIGLLLFYVLAAGFIGHTASIALVSAASVRLLGGRSWVWSLLFGLAVGVVSYLLFTELLNMPLPESIFRLNL